MGNLTKNKPKEAQGSDTRNATLAIRVITSFDLTAKTGYPMIERIQGQRSNPRGACEEDLEASSSAINKRLLSLTKGI
ncbi:hypothetical protein Tco_0342283 [Tanacetum coccineum]